MNTVTRTILPSNRAIMRDYAYDGDIFCADDGKLRAVKWILDNCLDKADRQIIIDYCESGGVRVLGRMLTVSKSTAHKEVTRIRKIILQEYERIYRNFAD